MPNLISDAVLMSAIYSGGFNPGSLANADRPMLAWWDASLPLTEVTGVSNMPDQGVNGLDFVQATEAAQPAFSGSGSSSLITYDGTADVLEMGIGSGDWQDLTYHEYWAAIFVDQSNFINFFNFNDKGGTKNNRVTFSATAAGNIQIIANDDSATNDVVRSDSALSVGWHVACFICNGSASGYSMIVDNSAEASSTTSGSNTGLFVGGLTNKTLVDTLSIGSQQLSGPSFSANLQKFDLSIGGTSTDAATTTAERTNIFNYINNRFQLGL